MANIIPMTTRMTIRALRQRGYSKRKIARELGLHRNTVSHYLEELEAVDEEVDGLSHSKCTISTPGSPVGAVPAGETTREEGTADRPDGVPLDEKTASKCTIPTPGSETVTRALTGAKDGSGPGRQSHCDAYRAVIEAKLEAQLNAKRIWQDLVDDHGFEHSYQSVKRFVAKLAAKDPQRVWRMECEPGEELQVDYGTLYLQIAGKRKKIHALRCTLSHSRKGYTEAMLRQDTESFIRGIENAFRHFGGVTKILVLDNLKAGVLKADVYDPDLNPKFATFCRHYNTVALPTRPRTPEHKGKVEKNVGYVKDSALKGRSFESLRDVNVHLRHWEKNVADKRIHGTTRRQVDEHFQQNEKPALQPLPTSLFPSFKEAKRRVHRDSYLEFGRAYYHVPPEYISRDLWLRDDGRTLRIFDQAMKPVIVHPKLEPGRFTKTLGCTGTPKSVEESLRHWQERVATIGEEAALWAKGLVLRRQAAALRVLMGVIHQLLPRHGRAALNGACAQARRHGHYRLAQLKVWIDEGAQQSSSGFLSEHALIRSMDTYGELALFDESLQETSL